jgi:hypothetical protein
MNEHSAQQVLESKATPISISQTVANVAAWSAAFGGIAASVVTGTILIPLGVAAIGGALGFVVTKKLDQSEKRPG